VSLDFYLEVPGCPHCGANGGSVYQSNITHNLNSMFEEAGVYDILWRGDGLRAGDVLPRLDHALTLMKAEPEHFRKFDAPNGWGTYAHAVPWLEDIVDACRKHPAATIRCSR
jgi:hypothetical protein